MNNYNFLSLMNPKDIPTIDSVEYDAFWENEKYKTEYGITIDNIFIHPWLYWHTQVWNIFDDIEDPINHLIKRVSMKPSFRDNEWIISEALDRAQKERKGVMIFGSRRLGKDLLNSSKLYYNGFEKTIGEAKIGDKIYDDSGNLTTIIDVLPQGKQPVYKITLLDGREVYCGLKHNWEVYNKDKKEKSIKTTEELLKDYKRKRLHNGYKDKVTREIFEYKYSIPLCKSVKYEEKELELDPYLLGLWLGDGSSYKTEIHNIDEEIINYLYTYAEKNNYIIKKTGKIAYLFTKNGKGKPYSNNFLNFLRNNNLLKNKHIPYNYKYSSIEQRLELLRGLMDSDGYCGKNGTIEFSSSIKQLGDDFEFVCRSLGIGIKKVEKQGQYNNKKTKISYRFNLFTDLPIFKLKRKLNNIQYKKSFNSKRLKTTIRKIEYVYDEETTCISVDNKSHLFLTDNFIVTHNSEFISSYVGQGATLYKGSENVVMGGNWGDIDIIMNKVDFGLTNLPTYFKSNRLANGLRKEIELGYKNKQGERFSYSKIICRNHDNGQNTESPAGLTPTRFIMDEVGKSSFSAVFEAAKPSFTSKFGWRCVPILTGTSGDIKKNSDAQTYFENPDSQNFISVELKDEGNKKTSIFISGLYRMEGKVDTTLGDLAYTQTGLLVPKDSILNKIPAQKKDDEKALAVINEDREAAAKSPDQTALLKVQMYYPLNTNELFLADNGNNLPLEAIKEHIAYLENNPELQGKVIKLFRDVDNKVRYSYNTDMIAFNDYPVKPDNLLIKMAGPVMYEEPMDDIYTYLYISGADPYAHGESENSNSIGSFYILKRVVDVISGTFQRRIVFSYNARPSKVEDFEKTCEMALELYNAVCMPESETTGFIRYFDLKNKSHMLADGYSFLKEISPTTSIKSGRNKGLPATKAVKRRMHGLIYKYLTEEIIVNRTDDGEPIIKLGLVRIPDIGLLKEFLVFNKNDGNFDRYIGFGMTLLHEEWADKIYPFVEKREQVKEIPFITPTKVKSPFLPGGGLFNTGKGNIFNTLFKK